METESNIYTDITYGIDLESLRVKYTYYLKSLGVEYLY